MPNKSSNPSKDNPAEDKKRDWFESFATQATHIAGSTQAFIIACIIVLGWVITGPVFHFSDTWQLLINTATTIATFLMVFLIQKTQNKDAIAIQIKLNELIAASEKASNRIVDIEELTEEELIRLHKYYTHLSEITKRDKDAKKSFSIEDTSIDSDIQKIEKEANKAGKRIKAPSSGTPLH